MSLQDPPVQDSVSSTTGPSGLAPGAKKPKKVRKGQSEEEYMKQKTQFHESGPLINTDDWLYDEQALLNLNKDQKTDRIRILHACEKAYYDRNYHKCLQFIGIAGNLFEIDLQAAAESLDPNDKKVCKMDRHILDLIYIRKKCMEKLS